MPENSRATDAYRAALDVVEAVEPTIASAIRGELDNQRT